MPCLVYHQGLGAAAVVLAQVTLKPIDFVGVMYLPLMGYSGLLGGSYEATVLTDMVRVDGCFGAYLRHGELGAHQDVSIDFKEGAREFQELHLGAEGVLIADNPDLVAVVARHLLAP